MVHAGEGGASRMTIGWHGWIGGTSRHIDRQTYRQASRQTGITRQTDTNTDRHTTDTERSIDKQAG